MNICLRVIGTVIAMLALGAAAVAQTPAPARASRTYVCPANAHCNAYCLVDGERQFQTGSPKEVTVTPLARNNYLVEVMEQTGATEFAYLAGTKVVCMFEGVSKKGE